MLSTLRSHKYDCDAATVSSSVRQIVTVIVRINNTVVTVTKDYSVNIKYIIEGAIS
jgi:hypothetical protein